MTPEEELFKKFFNAEKVVVASMELSQLRAYREELSEIAFQAKARLVAVDEEVRTRTAKSKNKEWLTSVTSDQAASDAINAVETRKKRMSKMDKLRDQLSKAGLDDKTVKEMIKNLEQNATDKNLNTITFTKKTEEVSAISLEPKKVEENKEFDVDSLFGNNNEEE